MTKSWRPYALHIIAAANRLENIRARGDLTKDEILYDAALRNLQTLSEATQRLPDTLKASFPEIPWSDIAGFRNILVHNYLGDIDAVTVADVLENDLPDLYAAIQRMLDA